MPDITIRQYESADLAGCRALWAEMVQQHRDIYDDSSIGGDDPGLEFDEHLRKVGPERIWVALAESEVVGFTSLIASGEEAEIEPLVVSSRHRGQGIGHRLVEHATTEAENLGVLCLSVKPVARNERVIAFFYDAGFKTLGHIQMFRWLGPSDPAQWKKGPVLFGKAFDY